jgi:phospholipid/cholesterol/gamma-HCH transport system ATP-binding protein
VPRAEFPHYIEFRQVNKTFDKPVLVDFSFHIDAGETVAIIGRSGVGKSVTLAHIMGFLKPDSGQVIVAYQDITRMNESQLRQIRRKVTMVFQNGALFDSLTVAENVGYRLFQETDLPLEQADARVQEVLNFVGLNEHAERMPSQLSGGQRRRVALARAMASKPNLLLLDDPTVGLDPIIAANIDDEIVKVRDLENVTAIVVTHQIRDAFYVARHQAVRNNGDLQIVEVDERHERAAYMVLHEGSIQFEGSGAELLAAKDDYLREFLHMTLPPW